LEAKKEGEQAMMISSTSRMKRKKKQIEIDHTKRASTSATKGWHAKAPEVEEGQELRSIKNRSFPDPHQAARM
jgi:hypothetical protein